MGKQKNALEKCVETIISGVVTSSSLKSWRCISPPSDYTMVNFAKPNLLGMITEFTNQFVNPIKNGQCLDSSPWDIRKMKHRAHVLHAMLKDTVQV